jgi:hypothetical protein
LRRPSGQQLIRSCPDRMTSRRQLRTNQRNALRSTGPRTLMGKLRSLTNAIKHGLTAKTVISVLEDVTEYESFERRFSPNTSVARRPRLNFAWRLASVLWRLRRAAEIESGLLGIYSVMLGQESNEPPPHPAFDMTKLRRTLSSAHNPWCAGTRMNRTRCVGGL